MQYLRIKQGARQIRANGSRYAVPIVITKTKKYGQVVSEKYISRKQPVLITGAHDAVRPLSAWSDSACVEKWWTRKARQDDTLKPWSKLKAWERQDKLPEYLADNKAMLFIDNADKLSGRKQQIAKECLQVQRNSVIAVSDEHLPHRTQRRPAGCSPRKLNALVQSHAHRGQHHGGDCPAAGAGSHSRQHRPGLAGMGE